MKLHLNARTCPHSRELLCRRVNDDRWSVAAAAAAAGVSERTAYKWLARFRTGGTAALADRSSSPRHVPGRTPTDRVAAIEALRRIRLTTPMIAEILRMPLSTVCAVCARIGLGRLPTLDDIGPVNRYERRRAGELLHIDVKKIARIVAPGHRMHGNRASRRRGAGWEFIHVCVDDATRIAYVEVLDDETGATVSAFLERAVAFFRRRGVRPERVLTDNGTGYRSHVHAAACRALGLRHLRTRPYRPQTNGKAERFIRSMLDQCLYAAIYASSRQREIALLDWVEFYNRRRPHSSLGRRTPLERLAELNNLAGIYN